MFRNGSSKTFPITNGAEQSILTSPFGRTMTALFGKILEFLS
jgi:hypothetical protein